jgi:monoamine oxidase
MRSGTASSRAKPHPIVPGSQDAWQLGGLSAFGPGELSSIPVNARREGRILFAGEHTSRWNGWMQGAIESAHRVVKEICA